MNYSRSEKCPRKQASEILPRVESELAVERRGSRSKASSPGRESLLVHIHTYNIYAPVVAAGNEGTNILLVHCLEKSYN